MIKRAMTMAVWATVVAAPVVVSAQAATTPTTTTTTTTPPVAVAPGTCDCPVGDTRGGLRNLAAFAPLGLLGALAAAGGSPAIFAATTPEPAAPNVAVTDPAFKVGDEVVTTDPGRNVVPEPAAPPTDVSTSVGNIPDPVAPDSLRAGIRAPNTATPLPSVLLLGSGLIAIGCVTLFRTRG